METVFERLSCRWILATGCQPGDSVGNPNQAPAGSIGDYPNQALATFGGKALAV
jgi:hypothetical protein